MIEAHIKRFEWDDDDTDKEIRYVAYGSGGAYLGHFSLYFYPPDTWSMFICDVKTKRQGVGRALLQFWAQEVGPHTQFDGSVDHHETLDILEDRGYFEDPRPDWTKEIPAETYGELPIINFLKSGGVQITKVEVVREKGDDPIVFFSGTT